MISKKRHFLYIDANKKEQEGRPGLILSNSSISSSSPSSCSSLSGSPTARKGTLNNVQLGGDFRWIIKITRQSVVTGKENDNSGRIVINNCICDSAESAYHGYKYENDKTRPNQTSWRHQHHHYDDKSCNPYIRPRLRSRSESPKPKYCNRTRRDRSFSPSPPSEAVLQSFANRERRRPNTSPKNYEIDGDDYKWKNTRDVMEGSVLAVINFLKSAGVPKPSTDQLERNLELGRWYATMVRSMDYLRCVESKNEDEMLAKVHLAVNAWESLCRFKALEYKRAYKHSYRLRFQQVDVGSHNKNAAMMYDHYSMSSSARLLSNSTVPASPVDIKQAIDRQINVAEQWTSCRKKLYLIHKWERRVLKQTKKAALFEPQGYQAVRYL